MGTGSIPFTTSSGVRMESITGASTTPAELSLLPTFSGFFLACRLNVPPDGHTETVDLAIFDFDYPWVTGVGSIPEAVTVTAPDDDSYRLYYSHQ